MTSLKVVIASARNFGWGSNEAVTWLYLSRNLVKHSDIWSENTSFKTLLFSPLTRISINVADSCLLFLLFLTSLNFLSGCSLFNVCGCHRDLNCELDTWHIIHTMFYYSKLLTYLSYDYGICSNISGIDLGGSGYRQFLIDQGIRNILDTKST
jgi:hypothetical protein